MAKLNSHEFSYFPDRLLEAIRKGRFSGDLPPKNTRIFDFPDSLLDPQSSRAPSRSSGLPTAFGWTSTGKHIAVVYELVDDDPLTFRPVTAYEVPPPSLKKKRRKR